MKIAWSRVIMKSFELGWGGNVAKTISLDHTKVINTNPRYAKLRDPDDHKKVIGFENIELISDRPFDIWLEEFRQFERDGEMPRFTVLSLPGDHLLGTRPGFQTPPAMMAES